MTFLRVRLVIFLAAALAPACASAANFLVRVLDGEKTSAPGTTVSYRVEISPSGVLSPAVGISVEGLPNGATYALTSAKLTAGGSVLLRITTSPTQPEGVLSLTVVGYDGTLRKTDTVRLRVRRGADFDIQPLLRPWRLPTNGKSSLPVVVRGNLGSDAEIQVSVTNPPAGMLAAVPAASVNGSGTVRLDLTTSSSIAART